MNLKLAFSTCPNDTFIFEALVNNRIEHKQVAFDVHLADIQELNKLALRAEPDVVKISYALYPLIFKNYQLLTSGSALGNGVGPLLISRRKIFPDEVKHATIAIPGEHTTANLLFKLAFPEAEHTIVYLFSHIEDAILSNEVDAGVIIHENRFTYKAKGLRMILDLGEYWEKKTGLPIPLGGIAVRRDLPTQVKLMLNELVRLSVETAMKNPSKVLPYVRKYAQSIDNEVIIQHITLYVNDYTVNLGKLGCESALTLFRNSNYPEFNKSLDSNISIFVDQEV
jgi:1,4-dihydroxy-6-naphthoate synthase